MREQKTQNRKIEIPKKRASAHAWLEGFKEIKENWLDEVKAERTGSKRTGEAYLDHMRVFVAYMNMTPAELIAKAFEEQKREMSADEPVTKTWAEQKTIACFNALQEQGRARIGALGVYGATRSFFRYNGIQFKGKTPTASVKTVYHLPTAQQLTQAWKVATLDQRLAAGIARSTGLRPEDLLALEWGNLQWQYDPKRAYIEKVSQKESLKFGVYLTAETSELVRLIMRKRYGNKIPEDAKLLDYNYNNLLELTRRFGKNAGLKLSPKYFRKLFRTRCSPIIGKEAVCKMAAWTLSGVGKHYFLPSPEDTLKNYLQIENLLTFEPKAVTEKEQVIENLIISAVAQGLPLEQAKQMRAIFRTKALTPEEAAIEVRKALEKSQTKEKKRKQPKTATNGGCAIGEHCQKIVCEADLEAMLAEGWRVAAVLPSGKIVVSNE